MTNFLREIKAKKPENCVLGIFLYGLYDSLGFWRVQTPEGLRWLYRLWGILRLQRRRPMEKLENFYSFFNLGIAGKLYMGYSKDVSEEKE